MAKAIKGVVKVIGAVASVLAVIPSPIQPIAAIVAIGASVASAGLEMVAPTKPKPPQISGSQTSFRLDPNAGIPYMMGRTFFAGNVVHRDTWGTDNEYHGMQIVWSGGGPIDAIEAFQVSQATVNFAGTAATGGFAGFMWLASQLGTAPAAALATPVAGFPNYNGAMSGYAAGTWICKFDKNGKKFAGGLPGAGIVGRGVKVYDPRLDSTYPGGLGPQRIGDEGTWGYSVNPWLHGLAWALGRYQNGKRVLGVGMAPANVNLASIVDAANVADANGWTIGGMVTSTDDKWEVLKNIAQAGGGQFVRLGASLTAFVNAPRIALATIGEEDLVGPGTVAATQGIRSRINRVVPQFRSEAHGWEVIPADPVEFATYVAEDGGTRTAETAFALVQDKDQVATFAAYEILDARELGPIDLQLSIAWMGLEPGDAVNLDLPSLGLGGGVKAIVLVRGIDPTTGSVSVSLRTETDAKHDLALGKTTTVPPSPSLVPRDLSAPRAPGVGAWALSAVSQIGSTGEEFPVLRVAGGIDNPTAEAILVRYRPVGAAGWTMGPNVDPGTSAIEIAGVQPGTAYEAEVAYRQFGVLGAWRNLGAVATGALTASGFVGGGSLAYEDAIYFNSPLFRESLGGDVATLANFKTALGTAAAIAGQGALATKSAVTWALDVNGKPPVISAESVTADDQMSDPSVWNVPASAIVGDYAGNYVRSTPASPLTPYHGPLNSIPVDPGATFEISADFFEEGAGAPTGTFYLAVVLYDTNGANIGGDGSLWYYPVYGNLDARNEWRRFFGRFGRGTARPFPTNAAKMGVAAILNYTGSGNPMRVRKLGARRIESEAWTAASAGYFSQADRSVISYQPVAGPVWGHTAWSKAVIRGPQRFTFSPTPRTGDNYFEQMAGLTTSPNPASYVDMGPGFYFAGTVVYWYWPGYDSGIVSDGGDRSAHEYTIEDDGLFLRWFIDGALVHGPITGPLTGGDRSWRAMTDCTVGGGQGIRHVSYTPGKTATVIGTTTFTAAGVALTQGALVTAEGVASAIAGQGALATLNGVTYGTGQVIGFGALSGLSYVYLGDGKIRRSDGATTLTESLVITSAGTAAAIAGQGDLATTNRAALPFGANALFNSDFTRGEKGFTYATGASDGQILNLVGVNKVGGWYGARNVWSAHLNGTLAAGQYMDALFSGDGAAVNSANGRRYLLPVKPGETLFARALIGAHRCTGQVFIFLYDNDSTLLHTPATGGGGTIGGGFGGDPVNFTELGLTYTVPAGSAARWALMLVRANGTGENDPYIFITEPALGKLAPGQTVIPPYTPGPADRLADATPEGTAAGIAGQAAAATDASIEGGADVTSHISSQAEIVFAQTYAGAFKAGQINPRHIYFKLWKNGEDVTASATWGAQSYTAGLTGVAWAGAGDLNISGLVGDATITVYALLAGRYRFFTVKLAIVRDDAPSTGGGGSGASGSSNGTLDATISGNVPTVGNNSQLTVTVGSGGLVSLSASYSFNANNATGSRTLNARWHRWTGSAWTPVGAGDVGASTPYFANTADQGAGACDATEGGLTAGSSQIYVLFMYGTNSSTTYYVSGECAAVGS